MLEQHAAHLNGLPVYYWESNPHAQETVIFVHGFRGEHSGLNDIAHLESNYRVILLDLPGFGLSRPMRQSHSIQNYAKLIHALLTRLGIRRIHLVGHSYGGSIAIVYAALYPETLHSLVLAMPAISSRSVSSKLVGIELKINSLLPPTLQKLWLYAPPVDAIGYLLLSKSSLGKQKVEIFRQKMKFPEQTVPRVITECLGSFNRTRFLCYAQKIIAPTLIIGGDKDFIATLPSLKLLCKTIKGSTLTVVPGTGHVLNLDNPRLLTKPIKDFIEKQSSARPFKQDSASMASVGSASTWD